MTSIKKDPVLVVLQLSGGNDYMNTVIPYTDPLYRDNRPAVGIADEDIIRINNELGFHPSLRVMQEMFDQGNLAVIHGVGYSRFAPLPLPLDGTFGTPASRTSWAPRAGWAWPPAKLTPTRKRGDHGQHGAEYVPRRLGGPAFPWPQWTAWTATDC